MSLESNVGLDVRLAVVNFQFDYRRQGLLAAADLFDLTSSLLGRNGHGAVAGGEAGATEDGASLSEVAAGMLQSDLQECGDLGWRQRLHESLSDR
jgi:hypothetical protein